MKFENIENKIKTNKENNYNNDNKIKTNQKYD